MISVDSILVVIWNLQFLGDNLASIDPRDMKLLPLDVSCWDESNELNSILLQSLDGELSLNILKFLTFDFFEFNILALSKVSFSA